MSKLTIDEAISSRFNGRVWAPKQLRALAREYIGKGAKGSEILDAVCVLEAAGIFRDYTPGKKTEQRTLLEMLMEESE